MFVVRGDSVLNGDEPSFAAPEGRSLADAARANARAYRQAIVNRVRQRIDRKLLPVIVARRASGATLDSIELHWRGDHLVLSARHAGSSIAQAPTFARITLTTDGLFDLAFARAAGKWGSLAKACTLAEVLAYFDQPSPMWPRELLPCDRSTDRPAL